MTARVTAGASQAGKITASLVYPEFFPVRASDRLLDLACGAGPQLAVYGARAGLAVGVDIQPGRIAIARETLGGSGGRCRLVVGDVTALPLRDGTFDRAIAIDVLEHLDDPGRLLGEARRVLVGSGRLLATVPALYDRLKDGPLGDVVRRLKGRGAYFSGSLGYDDHRPPRSLAAWRRLFEESGFRVARSRATTLFPPLHRYGVPRFWFSVAPLRRTISALGALPPLSGLGQAVMFDLARA